MNGFSERQPWETDKEWSQRLQAQRDAIRMPTVTLTQYRTDGVLKRKGWKPKCAGHKGGRKKDCTKPCPRSLKKLIFLLNNCDDPMRGFATLTMPPNVCNAVPPKVHYKFIEAAIKRCKYQKLTPLVWVKEFQENESIHWHLFCRASTGQPGTINEQMTRDWSTWMTNYYRRYHVDAYSTHYMEFGNGKDFHGCVRWEELQSDAGGKYAGKEGAKRYQKFAPERFRSAGGRWWGKIGEINVTPTGVKKVQVDRIATAKIKIGGEVLHIATNLQFNHGTNGKHSH